MTGMTGMTGAETVAWMLKQAKIRIIFSLSGNQIMPIYDACIDAGIRIVHVRHEAAAVFMADAWAQVTGEVGVAMVTAGPGFANSLSPLFTARKAESPVLLLSGDSPLANDGKEAFQEMDQISMSRPLVKLARRASSAASLGADLAMCIRTALSERKGPVHLALPADLLLGKTPDPAHHPLALQPTKLDLAPYIAASIADRIAKAKRPILLLGPQTNRSREPLGVKSLEQLGLPVIVMESPRGLRDPALGAFAEILIEADLIVSLGKQLDYTIDFAQTPPLSPHTRIIVVDPDRACLDRTHLLVGARIDMLVQADIASAIGELSRQTSRTNGKAWQTEVQDAVSYRYPKPADGEKIHPYTVCEAVNKALAQAKDPIVICDGGEFGQWTQACCDAPTKLLNGIGGAIGGGISYAIAAKIARPDATIITLMGDGSAGFHLMEFDTAAREGVHFTALVGNDHCWNAEFQIQLRDYGPNRQIGCTLSADARYDEAVRGLACHGERVTKPASLGGALSRALSSNLPALVNVEIDCVAAPVFVRTQKP